MHGTCCPRFPVLPVGWVWRGVPVGTPASRAPAHPPGGGLARARGSGCSLASSLSHWPLAASVLCARYRGHIHRTHFARGVPGCAVARPLTLGASLALCPPAGGIYYGAPSGGTLGFVSLWPFRPPSPHARACLGSSPRVRIAPPAPPSGGVLGLTAVVFSAPHCFGVRARGCFSFIRRRQILPQLVL